ncbi:DUF397 domain-containing protein [Streptomyces sp. NPDC002144]|uniref:DUF397 domain-containing protein n=1 Tax=Streptomyces sp. NPDC006668 TaxID=3156903 RepID=UPI0033C01740
MPAFEFVRSSYSGGNAGQECVEIARNIPGTVAVRDSKKTRGPVLRFAVSAWGSFQDGVRAGDLG